MKLKGFLIILLVSNTLIFSQENKTIAYSGINWYLDYDQALAQAAEKEKPVIIMFQGAIGCISCQNFGMHIISHPLMAEAVADHFIPLIVFDKTRGDGKIVLERLGDNHNTTPDMRIINSQGLDVVKATSNDYNYSSFSGTIIKALENYNTPIPEYLKLLHQDFLNKDSQTQNKETEKNTKSFLSRPYLYLPMLKTQQIQVSLALTNNQDPKFFLSPRQQRALDFISRHDNVTWEIQTNIQDFTRAWKKFNQRINTNQEM